MTIKLRQSTASQEVPLGYFLDSTDGNTEETALTIANTDIKLWKMGATALANKNSGGATHISNGIYYAVLDATDTNTLGGLMIFVHVAGALPVRIECEVLSANVYDALIAGTDNLEVDAVQISGDATAANNLETAYDDTAGAVPWAGVIDQGTAQSATSTTLVLRAAAAFADDEIIGSVIEITGGSAGVGQSRQITDYVSVTDTATVDAWTTTPTGTITYKIFAAPPAPAAAADVNVVSMAANSVTAAALAADAGTEIGTAVWATATRVLTAGTNIALAKGTGVTGFNDLDAAGVRTAVGLTSANLDTQLSTIDTVADSILVDTAEIGAAGAGLTALASASNLATVAGYIDTEVASILAAVDTEVASIKGVTDKIDGMLEGDNQSGNTYQFTATALAEAPAGGGGSGPTAAQIADAVWDEAITDHLTAGSTGAALNAAGSAGDPWTTPLPGAYGAGTAGNIIGNNLDAVVSTRASQTSLNTVDDFLDTEVAAILAAVDTEVAAIKAVTDKVDGMLEGDNQSGNTYQFTATALSEASAGGLDAAGVRTAVGLASANLDTQLSAIQADTQDIQSRMPAALVGGRMDASVGAMATNVLTAAATAADFTTEVQSGLATAAALATVDTVVDAILVDTAEIGAAGAGLTALASASNLALVAGYVDTEVAAIKAKTDSLTFTVGGQVDVNVQSINDVAITGNGQVGTEFGV